MPRIAYIDRQFSSASLDVIDQANSICASYQAQGFDLTLRQLYYQFVSRDLIANRQTEYKRLGSIINDARLAGLLDWRYIVDRTRNLAGIGGTWENPAEIVDGAARGYSIDKWADQPEHVEVWIEKDALVGVLQQACRGYDVGYFSCRGYTSQSEIWGAAQRLRGKISEGKRCTIIHLGDHDPSGIDMTRDIEARLAMFIAQDIGVAGPGEDADFYSESLGGGAYGFDELDGAALTVERIALNMDQVRRYNPPPNPAKMTDSRARGVDGYVARYGSSSWELDALDPTTLTDLIRGQIEFHRDEDLWDAKVEQETAERRILTANAKHWPDVARFIGEQWPDEVSPQ